MSLPHAILALLDFEKSSGYDLAKRFNSSISFFWSTTHQQVYRELGKLTEKGWVEFESVSQSEKPDKKVYHITEAGHDALLEWLNKPARAARFKEPMLIKLFAGRLLSREALHEEVDAHENRHRKTLGYYREMEQRLKSAPGEVKRRYLLPYMTMRLGIRLEEAWLEWIQEVRDVLNEQKDPLQKD